MIDVRQIDERIERRINYTQSLLAALLLVVIAVPFAFSWWYSETSDAIRDVSLTEMSIVSNTALCPGEILTTRHRFAAKGTGILIADATTWRITPPMTIVLSEARRFIVEGDSSRIVYRSYVIPATYTDERTLQQVPLEPGRYKRIISVSSESSGGIFSAQSVEFTVRGDCSE